MKLKYIALLFAVVFMNTHAWAENPLDYPVVFTYEPEYCDFEAAFPEEPLVSEQCEKEDDPSTCYKLVSYTKVFDLASTVHINIICNPSTPDMYAYFQPEAMESTVKSMTEGTVLKTFNIKTTDHKEEGYRLTGLVGQGKQGLDDTLYIAQLWTSENSIMSVEAELSGIQNDDTDKLFAGLLSHIRHKKESKKD